MPTYSYLCSDCDVEFDTIQKMNDIRVSECPLCNKTTNQLVYAPFTVINKTPTTIGLLADQNNSSLGRYEREDIIQKEKDRRKPSFEGVLSNGAEVVEKKSDYRPWYRKDLPHADLSLTKMTNEETKKYIFEGKKPIALDKRS